jgi:hypothetical protein
MRNHYKKKNMPFMIDYATKLLSWYDKLYQRQCFSFLAISMTIWFDSKNSYSHKKQKINRKAALRKTLNNDNNNIDDDDHDE